MSERPSTGRIAGASFVVSVAGSIGLVITYLFGGQPQLEGVFLGIALGGLALGLLSWARDAMPHGHFVQERKDLSSDDPEQSEMEDDFEEGAEVFARRRFLTRALGGALGALGLAALFPIRSLGKGPGSSLERTAFVAGSRLVTEDGKLVTVDDLEVGTVLTVFPEDAPGRADSQTVLIRLEDGALEPEPGRETWAPEGFVAYSKICTHAGCPVGLYEADSHELFCPCHQSVFDVLRAAEPTAGPATRPLPQLPLEIDPDGYLRATGDFSAPVGPAYWTL